MTEGVRLTIKPCKCGRTPKVIVERVAEDLMETWVECECGIHSGEIEGAYPARDDAIWNWNDGDRIPAGRAALLKGEDDGQ